MQYNNDNWPKRRNGTNKSLGEMTLEEQDQVFEHARQRFLSRGKYTTAVVAQALAVVYREMRYAEARRSSGEGCH